MMNGRSRVIGGIVLLIGMLLIVGAIGALAYNAGVAWGASAAITAEGAENISPLFYGPVGFHRFGPASWLLICLVVPFFFFLFFGAMKLIFAPWGMRHRGYGWGWKGSEERRRHFEEMAAEWHRKAHEAEDQKAEEDKV